MTRIRARANGNIVDVPEMRAQKLVMAGIFEYVDEPKPLVAAAPVVDAPPVLVEPDPEPTPSDLSSKTRAELLELARDLEVQGTGTNGYLTKDDLVRALSRAHQRRDLFRGYGRRDLRAES